MTKTRAVVFLNGDLSLPPKILRPNDFLIGVDGGSKLVARLGRKPDLIIGDLDSLPQPPKGVPIIKYPTDKDQTDSELALNYAIKEGFKEILLVGFLGKRLDHMISNLFLAATAKASISIIDHNQQLFFVRDRLILSGRPGQLVSLIPVLGDCVVTTSGLKWRLQGDSLKFGSGRGVSNVMTGKKASIKVTKGLLLVIVTL